MNQQNALLRQRLKGRELGFSLLELMITVGILSIIAAIAIPSYQSYTLRAHRTEAKTALLDIASMEERYFTTNNTYSNLPTDLGYGAAGFPFNTLNGYYTISITPNGFNPAVAPSAGVPAGTPATYSFTATATGPQVADTACNTLVLDSKGTRTATGTDPNANADCWN